MRAAAWMALLAVPTLGAATEVISPRPDTVSVTIYRDLFALVTETRTIDLPEGAVTLSFDGVVETLLPASAVVADSGRTLEERNYDYDALTPSALFRKSIGEKVILTRTLPGSGEVKQLEAVVVSAAAGGITFRTVEGNEALHCSGLPEHVTFEKIPDALHPRPRLSVRLAPGPAGPRTVTIGTLPPTPKFADVSTIVMSRCAMCHAAEPVWAGLAAPPKGVLLDTDEHIYLHAPLIAAKQTANAQTHRGEPCNDDRWSVRRWPPGCCSQPPAAPIPTRRAPAAPPRPP